MQTREEILAGVDCLAEAKGWGLDVTGTAPNADGWIECRAIDREDRNPSASFNARTGSYKDFGGDGEPLGFFDLAVQLGRFPDWRAAKVHYASLANGKARANGRVNSSNNVHKPKTSVKAKVYPSAKEAGEAARRGAEHEARQKSGDASYTLSKPDYQYPYHNANSETVGLVLRWDFLVNGEPNKLMRPLARVEGGWIANAIPALRPLYRLPTLAGAGTVYVCEGEKATETARRFGLPATTSSGGSGAAKLTDWSPLRGRHVVIFPDRDAAGEKYALDVARLATAAGAISVRIIRLPNLEDGEDFYDWDLKHDSQTAEDLMPILRDLIDETPAWQRPEHVNGETSANDWPDPTPLPEAMPGVVPFNFDLLPDGLRQWIEDIAERTQCPPDFPAIGAMVGLASLLGRKIRIRPKRHDDWTVTPNLWGAVVGRPGVMKSPALSAVTKPLQRIEAEAKDDYLAAMREHKAVKLVAEETERVGKSRIKDALKNGGDAQAVALGVLNETEDAETPPARRRCVTNDSTVEKLGEVLAENTNGVLVFRDELTGFLRSLDKEGHEAARAFYLEAWNGDGRYTFDRIGRGTIDIEAAIVSILGGIQPGPLSDYVRGAASDGRGADGLLQRFQLVVWPDVSKNWRNVDRWPDTDIKNRAHEIYFRLDSLTPEDCDCENEDDVSYLRFTPEAQERFDEWRGWLELRLRADIEHPAFEAHLSKYRSLIPSVALICHLVEQGNGPVGIDSIDRAIRWGNYLESHARRLYGSAINGEIESAYALAKRIQAGELSDGFTLRDVYRPQWSGLRTREDARQAVDVLVDHDMLRDKLESTDGRSKTTYRINPRFFEKSPT